MDEDYKYILTPATDLDIIEQAEHKEVRYAKDIDLSLNNPVPYRGGLYDLALFGQIHRCSCGATRVPKDGTKTVCSYCHTLVFPTAEEWYHNSAYFHLSVPVVFPYKIDALWNYLSEVGLYPVKPASNELKKITGNSRLISLWNTSWRISTYQEGDENYVEKGGYKYTLTIEEVGPYSPKNSIGLVGLNYLNGVSYKGNTIDLSKELNTCLPITSTYFRPYNITYRNENKILEVDERSSGYAAIITESQMIPSLSQDANLDAIDIATMLYNFNLLIWKFMNTSSLLQGGKFHTVRDSLRQRVRKSARANIYPALDLDMNHIYVPRSLAWECLNGDIIDRLSETMDSREARKLYDSQDPKAVQAFNEIIDNCICLTLRQPVLHRFSMVALYPIVNDEPGIGIPIDICGPLNADFDGDQIPIFFITEPDLVDQLANSLTPHQVWFYEKNSDPVFQPTHEILYGLYLATKMDRVPEDGKLQEYPTFEQLEKAYEDGKIEFDTIVVSEGRTTTYGRRKVEMILGDKELSTALDDPERGRINEPITSKNVGIIVAALQGDSQRATKIHELTEFAAEIITHQGMDTPPFNKIYDFDDPKVKELIDSKESSEVKYTKLKKYINDTVLDTLKKLPDNNIANMLSGSGRVKPQQLEKIYAPAIYRGEVVDISPSNLFQGLTERDFVSAGLNNRKIQQIKSESIPMSGFLNRQMILSQMELKFRDAEESPDTVGLLIPRSKAVGRTLLDGTKVKTRGSSQDRVRVKSCLNHDDNIVYADEIDNATLKVRDGASIGISFAMSFMEANTQAALALKHGTGEKSFEDESIVAQRSGEIIEMSDFLVVQTETGSVDRYLLHGNIAIVGNISVGSRVEKGQKLVISARLKELHDNLVNLQEFLGLQSATKEISRERGRDKLICYAPKDGVISYPSINGVIYIKIGDLTMSTSPVELYYYPEGYRVKEGERFCSGLLDLGEFHHLNPSDQDTFDIFVRQIEDILHKTDTRSELYEVTYKCLKDSNFDARSKYTNTPNFINRLYYGASKQGIQKFYTESRRTKSGGIGIADSIILPLVMGFDKR